MGGLEALIEKLCGPEMAVRSVEPEVKALSPTDADQAFAALKERVLRHGSFSTAPPGFEGLAIVAKHHPRYQTEILNLLTGIDPSMLGIWVVKGWNEILTAAGTKEQLGALMNVWATQDQNQLLKKAAGTAISTLRRRAD